MKRRTLLHAGTVGGIAGILGVGYVLSDPGGTAADAGGNTTDAATDTTTATPTTAAGGSPTPSPAGASFEDASVEAPSEPTVGESVDLSVSVTNEGDAAGAFTASLAVTGPEEWTKSVRIDDVAPGERGETTVPLSVAYAGTYTARLRTGGNGSPASAEFTVQPRRDPLGEAVAVSDSLELTVSDTRVEPTLIAEGQGPYYLQGPVPHVLPAESPRETDLLVVTGSVTNTGDRPATFDPSGLSFTALHGDPPTFYTDVGRELFPGVPVSGVLLEGEPLAGREIQPGETVEGWLLAPIAHDTATGSQVRMFLQRAVESDPEAVWGVIPEGGADLPEFEAENLSLPDSVTNTETGEFSLTVTNTGDAPGTFRDVLAISSILPEFDPVGRITGEIPPGETRELTGEFLMAWWGTQGFNLQRSDTEYAHEFDDPEETGGVEGVEALCEGEWKELGFGPEPVTLPSGVTVRLTSPVFTETMRYSREVNYSGGYLLVLVTATLPEWARGEGLGKRMLPGTTDFSYKHSHESPLPALRPGSEGATEEAQANGNALMSPVTGPVYPVTPSPDPPDGTEQGWLELVNGADGWPNSQREVWLRTRVKYTEDGEEGKIVRARWSQKFG